MPYFQKEYLCVAKRHIGFTLGTFVLSIEYVCELSDVLSSQKTAFMHSVLSFSCPFFRAAVLVAREPQTGQLRWAKPDHNMSEGLSLGLSSHGWVTHYVHVAW